MSELRFEESAVRPAPPRAPASPARRFRLDRRDGKLMGVCSGIARHFGWDVTLVRVGFVAATLLGLGSAIVVYLAIGLIAD